MARRVTNLTLLGLALAGAVVACLPTGEPRAERSAPRAPAPVAPRTTASFSASPSEAPASDLAAEALLVLPIAARAQAEEAPSAGWCGETAIQEGLLHLGAWAPQRLINRAGRPTHPDLYSPEIPIALSELGVRYVSYGARERGFDGFARWARAALEAGDPVLAGVKILPTAHPEWGLDHFVLVVGHGAKGLLVNTTWGTRQWVADTSTPGLSFKNAFYGLRLLGLTLPARATPARLTLLEERDDVVKVRASCAGLRRGVAVRLERRGRRADPRLAWSETRTPARDRIDVDVALDADQPARFHCVEAIDAIDAIDATAR